MNFSALCPILVAFGPETYEFTLLTIAPFFGDTVKNGIARKISQNFPDLS